jgi:hypothetical protein
MPLSGGFDGIASRQQPERKIDMTTKGKVERRKLSLLELATELSNVSRACKVMGYSRQQFYELRRNFQTYGAEGLLDRLPGAKGPHPNRVAAEIEQAVLDHALAHPCHGALRVEQELRLKVLQVSAGGIRGAWMRHDLLTKHQRLLRLEKATAERKIELSEEQVRLLGRFLPEFRERHIEAPHTGALVAVDTFFVGTLKGVARSTCRPPSTVTPAMRGRGLLTSAPPVMEPRACWPRLGQALSEQAAGAGGASDEWRRAAHLRGRRRQDRRRALG